MRARTLLLVFVSSMAPLATATAAPAPKARKRPAGGIRLPRQDCRVLLPRPGGGIWVIGVEDTGNLRLTATRQRVTLSKVVDGKHQAIGAASKPGFVFFAAAAAQGDAVWAVWSELADGEWRVMARRWSDGKFGATARVSGDEGPALWPCVAVAPDGRVHCAWSAPGEKDFDIWHAAFADGKWGKPTRVTGPGLHAFRPSLAAAADGTLWLACDYYADEGIYRIDLRSHTAKSWGKPVHLMLNHQSPSLRIAKDGTVWVVAADGKAVGWKSGQKVWLKKEPPAVFERSKGLRALPVSFDEAGRLWAFATYGGRHGKKRGLRLGAIVGDKLEGQRDIPGVFSTSRPPLVHGGKAYLVTNPTRGDMSGRLRIVNVGAVGAAAPATGPMSLAPPPKPPRLTAVKGLRPKVALDGKLHTIYFGELHTHLGENPSDAEIRTWVDRFYPDARYRKRLDLAAVSDHDWPSMTQSKYLVQQAIARVLSEPGEFVALFGYEWSGDGPTRKRYGDRTVVFPPGYFPPPRISDPASNTPAKLHAAMRKIGAINWPHHVGAPWAVMDWTTFENDVQPVVEITSGHGVFETYDPKTAVPVRLLRGREPQRSLKDKKVDKTSIQYGLAQGKVFGLVGSSDRHSGFSGYRTGMLGLFATELTAQSVFDAWRSRRTYAIRGGDRIQLMLRCGEARMGTETTVERKPTLSVLVKGTRPIARVEIVRDNRFIYTVEPKTLAATFDYRDADAAPGKHYYYIRVWQDGGGYAWSTPLWVTVK